MVTRELHHGYHCPDVRPGAHPSSDNNQAQDRDTHLGDLEHRPCHTLVTIVLCVTKSDIRDIYDRDDDGVRVWVEAGSDQRSQVRIIREHVWADDEEGEAAGGGGWTPGATLHRKHRYFPRVLSVTRTPSTLQHSLFRLYQRSNKQ